MFWYAPSRKPPVCRTLDHRSHHSSFGSDQRHDHLDDVPRCSELSVLSCGRDLCQQILVQIPLHILKLLAGFLPLALHLGVQLVDNPDGLLTSSDAFGIMNTASCMYCVKICPPFLRLLMNGNTLSRT